jgi:hypothetical protein
MTWRYPKYFSQLNIVNRHQGWFRSFLDHAHQPMDIFNRSKCFLHSTNCQVCQKTYKTNNLKVKKNEKLPTCQSSSSVAIFSCSNLVSRYNCKLSGAERSGRSRWSRYLLRLAKWFLMISQSLRNSVVRLYCLQNWKARWAVIWIWQ